MTLAKLALRSTRAAALAAVAALVLAACGGGDGDAAAPAADSVFNTVDVTFAQQMIPHHSQAVKMAALASSRAKDPEVKELAAKIVAAQGPEIETLQGFLDAWDQPLVADMGGMDHSSMSPEDMAAMGSESMPGMAEDGELKKLTDAKGATFDSLFLTLMLEHHRGAVEMAKRQLSSGKETQAKALAGRIEAEQTKEIAEIEDLRE